MLEAQIASELNGNGNGRANDNGNGTMTVADPSAKAEFAKLLGSRSGGAYVPPARFRAMQAEAAKDKKSAEFQRLSWDALRKSINGLINKVSQQDQLFSSLGFTSVVSLNSLTGQHLQHQACRARAIRRESHTREGLVRAVDYASSSVIAPLHSHFRGSRRNHQYKAAAGRRARLDPVDQSVSSCIQEERQGKQLSAH